MGQGPALQPLPTHGVGSASRRVPRVKCSVPVPLHHPCRTRQGTGSRAGRAGVKGPHSSLQYTHTVQYHSNDVRPSVCPPHGEARLTHPHAGPAHPSDTGETRDEVGGHVHLLVNHVGGAPRRVGVQQAVHGAEPGWVLLDREGSLHVDGVALVFEHAIAQCHLFVDL